MSLRNAVALSVAALLSGAACDIIEPTTGEPYNRDPRSIAKKAEAYLKSTGVGDAAFFGPEAEFFVFDDVKYSATPYNTGFRLDDVELPTNSDTNYDQGNMGHRPNALNALGVESKELSVDEVKTTDLQKYSTIIVDNRVYESQPELVAANQKLLDYAKDGGTMVNIPPPETPSTVPDRRVVQKVVLPGQTPQGEPILSVLIKRTYDIAPGKQCVRVGWTAIVLQRTQQRVNDAVDGPANQIAVGIR